MNPTVYIHGNIGSVKGAFKGIELADFVAAVQKQLRNYPNATELDVDIYSDGGVLETGKAMYQYLKSLPVQVNTIARKAYSIASVVVLAGAKRKGLKNSKSLMIHNNWVAGITGDADTVQFMADKMKESEKELIEIYNKETGIPKEAIDELMRNETYISTEKAIELGFLTEVYEPELQVAFSKKQSDMKKENLSLLNWAKKLLSTKQLNVLKTTTEGVSIFIDTTDDVLEGKTAYVANQDGTPSETLAPAGVHTLDDGMVLTIDDSGVVVSAEAKPEENAELAALKSENETLKNELAEIKTELAKSKESADTELQIIKEQLNNVTAEHVQLAKAVVSDYKAPAKFAQFNKNLLNKEEVEPAFDKDEFNKARENYKSSKKR